MNTDLYDSLSDDEVLRLADESAARIKALEATAARIDTRDDASAQHAEMWLELAAHADAWHRSIGQELAARLEVRIQLAELAVVAGAEDYLRRRSR